MRSLIHQEKLQKLLDRAAITFSALCVLHCLLTSVLIVILPVLGNNLPVDEKFHQLLLWIVLSISLSALSLGCFRHGDRRVILLGLMGLSQLVFTVIWGREFFSEFSEGLMTILGSATLAIGHWRNYQLCGCHPDKV